MIKRISFIICAAVIACACVLSLPVKVNADAESSANVYDISDIVNNMEAGGEVGMKFKVKYVSDIALNLGDTVEFEYKERDTLNKYGHYARTAFSIGSYGVYFYHTSGDISVRTCNMQSTASNWARGSQFATIPADTFKTYNKIALKAELKSGSENTVVLTMTYGDSSAVVSCEFAKDNESDMLFRFGDHDVDGNGIRSCKSAVSLGEGVAVSAIGTEGLNSYGGSFASVIAQENALSKGVPAGFTGNVLKVCNGGNPAQTDVLLDFTAKNLKRKLIGSVSFKVYIVANSSDNDSYPQLRIPVTGTENWIIGGSGATRTGEWVDVTLTGEMLDKLCKDGYLSYIDVCFRTNENTVAYICDLQIQTIEIETEPPVIRVAVSEFKVSTKSYPAEDAFTVTDNSGTVFVETAWSSGALDNLGRLNAGTHTLTIIATDPSDNVSRATITYIVTDDEEPELYKITFKAEGYADVVVEYTADETEYIQIPAVPVKEHYTGTWEKFAPEYSLTQVVNAEYKPTEYIIVFVADGKIISEQKYTILNKNVTIPDVPYKQGYNGSWEEFSLDGGNIRVNARYERNGEPIDSSEEPIDSSGSSSFDNSSSSNGDGQSSSGDNGSNCSDCSGSVSTASVTLFVLAFAAIVAVKNKKRG